MNPFTKFSTLLSMACAVFLSGCAWGEQQAACDSFNFVSNDPYERSRHAECARNFHEKNSQSEEFVPDPAFVAKIEREESRDRILKVKTTWEGVKKQVRANIKAPIPTYPDPAWLQDIWCRPNFSDEVIKSMAVGIEVIGPNTLRSVYYWDWRGDGGPTIDTSSMSVKVQDGVITIQNKNKSLIFIRKDSNT